MVNTEDFIKRLEYMLDYNSLSASSFADKIGVQRSSISHLLSGRNKPSLDFVMKIREEFPAVDLYWLLEGKGHFLKTNDHADKSENTISGNMEVTTGTENQSGIQSEEASKAPLQSPGQPLPLHYKDLKEQDDNIYKIVIFYKNGTFKDFKAKDESGS